MLPYLTESLRQPIGDVPPREAGRRRRPEGAPDRRAGILGARPTEVVFTGGGTESINTAIKGVAFQQKLARAGNHIVTTTIEHHAVLHACQYLERFGFEVTYVPVDRHGPRRPGRRRARDHERRRCSSAS